jgi:sulfite exporter TauE/SafE/copper chaperone CopZ
MKIEHESIQIKGMTCSNCEIILKGEFRRLRGIKSANVDYAAGTADIRYDADAVSLQDIRDAVHQAGYTVAEAKSDQRYAWLNAIAILVILFAVYQLFSRLGLFSIIPQVQSGMSLLMLFLVGVMTSVHCVAMCGGINLSAVATRARQNRQNGATVRSGLLYNSGRVVSYTLTGALVGLFGQLFSLSDQGRNTVTIIAALFMILMGLNMLGFVPWLRKIRLPLPASVVTLQARISQGSPFYIGLFNGLMPCGPLQTMQLYALGTGSMLMGALSMFFFAAGTVPLMLGVGLIAGLLSARNSRIVKIVSAGLVILLGLQMFGRAADLPMIIQAKQASASSNVVGTAAVLSGDYQYVETRITNGRYQPIIVQSGIPVRWNIIAEPGDLNGCNRSIKIDAYQVSKDLAFGENQVEFIPGEAGLVRYTCWMNMISSYITVVEDLSAVSGPG